MTNVTAQNHNKHTKPDRYKLGQQRASPTKHLDIKTGHIQLKHKTRQSKRWSINQNTQETQKDQTKTSDRTFTKVRTDMLKSEHKRYIQNTCHLDKLKITRKSAPTYYHTNLASENHKNHRINIFN